MSGAALSGFHAQAARLSALANAAPSAENEDDQRPGAEFHSSEYGSMQSDAERDADHEHANLEPSDEDIAYRANTEAFDAGADMWAMLSVIQRD